MDDPGDFDPYTDIDPERRKHIDALSVYSPDGVLMWNPPEPMTLHEQLLWREKWAIARAKEVDACNRAKAFHEENRDPSAGDRPASTPPHRR